MKKILFLCYIIFHGILSFGVDLKTFVPVSPSIGSARFSGMGGPHTAMTDCDFESFFNNPAVFGFVQDEKWMFSRLSAKIEGPTMELLNSIPKLKSGGSEVLNVLTPFITASNGLTITGDVQGPLAFGWMDRNIGIGVFNRTFSSLSAPNMTTSYFNLGEEIALYCSYGRVVLDKPHHVVTVGGTAKGFLQFILSQNGSASHVVDSIADFNIKEIPVIFSRGFGIDVGAQYILYNVVSFGISIRDLLSPAFYSLHGNLKDLFKGKAAQDVRYGFLKPNLALGVCYSPNIPWLSNYVTRWDFMIDYYNLLDFIPFITPYFRNPILNLSVGTELTIHNVLRFRMGLNEGYLAAGTGLDLSFCKMDISISGKELGYEPGSNPQYVMEFTLTFDY